MSVNSAKYKDECHNWDDVIMSIGLRTIKEIQDKGASTLINGMTRNQIAINRIWCKALIRYLMRNKKWANNETKADQLKALSNFTQYLRTRVTQHHHHSKSRTRKRYDGYITYLKFSGMSHVGWSSPYRVLVGIFFSLDMVEHVIGTDSFKFSGAGL